MKTIFITIFEGVEAKNILRTPILKNLLNDKEVRIVLFTKSLEKLNYYRQEFKDPRISFEVVESKKPRGLDNIFSKLKFILLRTRTTDLKRKMLSEYEGESIKYLLGKTINYIFAWPIVRRFVRFLDFLLVKDSTYSRYFDIYKPDLVFLAHLFDEPELGLLREAKKRKVTSIGFINSWDKVTSRCILRLLPDRAIVFNEIVKKELIRYNEIKDEDIYVSSLPQYDYFYEKTNTTRKDFFSKIGVLEDKKLLVYAPMGRSFSTADWEIIDLLISFIKSDVFKKKCELLVRFQPNDFVDNLQDELGKRPDLKYDLPGKRFGTKRGVDWDMDFNDLKHLRDTLTYSDIVISYASSISIDAAVFDRPVININFEITKSKYLIKSPTQYYFTEHYSNAIQTGGIDMVKSKEEMIEVINKYLENPEIKREERKKLVEEQCSFTDGNSGKRISDYILNLIK